MKPTSDVPLMMKELHAQEATTPRSRLHRKCASVLTSRRSAPGGVWGSDTTLLASPVNGSGAGYVPHTTPIPRSGFVHGPIADTDCLRDLLDPIPRRQPRAYGSLDF